MSVAQSEKVYTAYMLDGYQTVYIEVANPLICNQYEPFTGQSDTKTQREMLKGAFRWKILDNQCIAFC